MGRCKRVLTDSGPQIGQIWPNIRKLPSPRQPKYLRRARPCQPGTVCFGPCMLTCAVVTDVLFTSVRCEVGPRPKFKRRPPHSGPTCPTPPPDRPSIEHTQKLAPKIYPSKHIADWTHTHTHARCCSINVPSQMCIPPGGIPHIVRYHAPAAGIPLNMRCPGEPWDPALCCIWAHLGDVQQ